MNKHRVGAVGCNLI